MFQFHIFLFQPIIIIIFIIIFLWFWEAPELQTETCYRNSKDAIHIYSNVSLNDGDTF